MNMVASFLWSSLSTLSTSNVDSFTITYLPIPVNDKKNYSEHLGELGKFIHVYIDSIFILNFF